MAGKRGKSAAAWVLAGLVCVGASYLLGDWYNWEPLSQGVALKPGVIETRTFSTDRNGYYEIAVNIDKDSALDNAPCLLGIDPSQAPDGCKDASSLIDISWTLSSGGEQIAQGDSSEVNDVYAAGRLGRVIGEFWGQRGGQYALALNVKRDGSTLDVAHPRLVVKVNEDDSNDYAVYSQILFFGGLSLGFVGLVLLMNASATTVPPRSESAKPAADARLDRSVWRR